jgi:hypothetical protein
MSILRGHVVKPTPKPQPEEPIFYTGVYSPRDMFPLLRTLGWSDPATGVTAPAPAKHVSLPPNHTWAFVKATYPVDDKSPVDDTSPAEEYCTRSVSVSGEVQLSNILYKNPVPVSQKHSVSIVITKGLVMFRKIIWVNCDNHAKDTDTCWAICRFL